MLLTMLFTRRSPLVGKLYRAMSTIRPTPLLLTPSQVSRLPPQSTALIDASWVMPNSPRKPKEEFTTCRIPRARFLDIDEVATHTEDGQALGLKHMMPAPEVFANACEKLGITRDSHVILYDTNGCFSSPRALFMFRAFSHNNSSVLNGGLPQWIHEGLPVETGPPNPAAIDHDYEINEATQPFLAEDVKAQKGISYPVPSLNKSVIRSYEQMVSNSSRPRSDTVSDLVLDARSRGRYLGVDPEPRPGLSSGHIPGSFSLPFNQFLESYKPSADSPIHNSPLQSTAGAGYTVLRAPEDLSDELRKSIGLESAEQILSGQRSVVTTCGSGMTAAVLWLGLSSIWEARQQDLPTLGLYDESWTGYAARKESKIIKGEE